MSQAKISPKIFDVLRYPHITEKTTNQSEYNQVVFIVEKTSTKEQIKAAVEHVFNVKVKAVNTVLRKGKTKVFRGRLGVQSSFKKAIITLEQGQTIDMASGV